jgi:HEAT repeat protein
VRVVVERSDGVTTDIRTYVGGRWRSNADATDLGTVGALAASQWLLGIAERDDGKPARDAILAATLADSADVWRQLLRIARNESRSREVRNQAVFWVADLAGDKVSASLDSLAYEDGDRDVRRQAIFAISQRPKDESVPLLIRMAETIKDRELRKQAIFWLGQTRDPRAMAWFEQVLASGK